MLGLGDKEEDRAATTTRWKEFRTTSSSPPAGFHVLGFLFFLTGSLLVRHTESVIYVSNGTDILKLNGRHQAAESIFSQPSGKIIGLAVDIQDGFLFWSDVSKRKQGIYWSNIQGRKVRLIVGDVEECNGLAVDWVSNHLYWTDARMRRVEIANYDGSGRRILIGSGLKQPRGIAVDPILGYLFWADQGTKRIERARLDGSEQQVLVDTYLHWPNQLAISHANTRRLYWVDAWYHSIMSCNMDGRDVTMERNMTRKAGGNPIFGLAVFGNRAIISVWYKTTVYSTLVAATTALWETEASDLGEMELYSLIVVDQYIQPTTYSHQCGNSNRAGCSHLCLPIKGAKYQCACPSFGGLALGPDTKTCQVSDKLLFYTLTDTGQVGFHAVGWPASSYLTLVAWTSRPSAITYDPMEKTVYWSDVEENMIYQVMLDGSSRDVFLNASHGIGIVDGLAIDWIQRRLYFTNIRLPFVSMDGSAYYSRSIQMITLNKRSRRTIVSAVDKPRGLDLDLVNGYLYYTDWGQHPKVVRTLLDGSEPEILRDTGLSSPNGVAVANGNLYVTDSNYNNRTGKPQLMVYSMATNHWSQISVEELKLPMGVAVGGDNLFYADWRSEHSGTGYVWSFSLNNRERMVVSLTGKKPTGLHFSPRKLEPTGPDLTCDNAACTDECIRTPRAPSSESFHCLCPDGASWILSADKTTCNKPKNFLLVADLSTIKMQSLDRDTDTSTHVLYYGSVGSNYVALAYDPNEDVLFWSNLHRGSQSILYSDLDTVDARVLIYVNYSIDGMAVDARHQKLFWTGYSNTTGLIAELNLQRGVDSYRIVLTDLDSPRAIALSPENKLMFWSEYGLSSGKAAVYRAHPNGRHQKTLMSKKLHWPNSLAIHEDNLYVADGFYGRIYLMDFNGSGQRELLFLSASLDHIFGLVIHEHLLIYSQWYTKRINMVDLITGEEDIIMSHLVRPTTVFVHHPSNLSDNGFCAPESNDCSGICVPVPHGYHCTCPLGFDIVEDNCVRLTNSWRLTDEVLCPGGCANHAQCSQHIPQLEFHCVCEAGFQWRGNNCKACSPDTFKSMLGNSSCQPCPKGSGTQGAVGSMGCVCDNPESQLISGSCKESSSKIMSTTSLPVVLPRTSTSPGHVATTIKKTFLGTISKPYFEQCPSRKTLTILLPAHSSKAYLPITWTARDYLRNKLPLESDFTIQNGQIEFRWTSMEQQKVTFNATDKWQQKTSCVFYVTVKDKEPPTFTHCPNNIVIKTTQYSEHVLWRKPTAEDNVKVNTIFGTHQGGSEFLPGVTMVNYTAFDKAGNSATCNFTVTIIPETNCDLPAIRNGAFMCGVDSQQLNMCYISCDPNFGRNPLGIFGQSFNCKLPKHLKRLNKIMQTQKACLPSHYPSNVQQMYQIQFQGPCEPNNVKLHAKLSAAVIQYLEAQNLCWDVRCCFSNLTVLCGMDNNEHRRKRANYFTVRWNVTISNSQRFPKKDINRILVDIERVLTKLVEVLFINLKEREYYAVPGSVKAATPNWLCESGEMKQDELCIPCPPGSWLNTSGLCSFCPARFYQSKEGQTRCIPCPDGVTAEEGTVSLSDCIAIPAIDEMSKLLIITTCTFGFVFLCLVIFMYLQYQRQQRKANSLTAVTTSPRNLTPNVYVAPPPFPRVKPVNDEYENREYMYVHEYEDIDNAEITAKIPNNAMYRLPPHMQRRLASTENIYDD